MAEAEKHPVVEILKEAQSWLGGNLKNLGVMDAKTYHRWLGGASPSPGSARLVGRALWIQLTQPGREVAKQKVLAFIQASDSTAPQDWNEEIFVNYLFKLAQTVTQRQLAQRRERKAKERKAKGASSGIKPVKPGRRSDEEFDPQNAVHARINEIFERAGFTVSGGCVHQVGEKPVHLGPLYTYVGRLQKSAQVANPFLKGHTIPLDALYVELTTTEDQRSLDGEGRLAGNEAAWADRPSTDPLGEWRAQARRHRIPLETLVSRTEIQPAVLFGDPGSGKSTLTEYALHAIGRGLVQKQGFLADDVLPFRIFLREFAVEGLQDQYGIIPYLLREKVGVPAEMFDDWSRLLGKFFWNEKPLRLLLLVDGVDEVTINPNLFPIIRSRLEDIAAIARLIITSRRAGFEAPVRSYGTFELVELQEPSIHGLIQNWFTNVNPRPPGFFQSFSRWVFGDARRQEMAGNPCLLSLLCYLNQDCPEDGFIQCINRAALYQQAVEKLTSDYDRLGATPLRASLDHLAGFALERYVSLGTGEAPHVLFTGEEVRMFFHRVGSNRHVSDQFSKNEALDLHLDEVWLKTRLVSQWNLGDWYHFIHQSFQEYFAARWLAVMPEPEVARLIDQHRFNPYWREVWRFYAGLNRAQGAEGKSRFNALAVAHVTPHDFYDQTLFWLAPLCAEFGLGDTTTLLGFDLRDRLYQLLLQGHSQTRAHIRRMVDMDPAYFLDLTTRVLDSQRARYEHRGQAGKKAPEDGDVRLAVQILESIYHQDALRYHQELIQAEVHCPALKRADPALGPVSPSGRNEPLSEVMCKWLETSAGRLQRERLVRYLACTRGPDAAPAILAAARREAMLATKPKANRGERAAVAEFQAHCVWALAELQDVRAVTLARELWPDPEFRAAHVPEVSSILIDVKHPDVPELLEEWLAELGTEASHDALVSILEVLKEWPMRPIPAVVNAIIEDPNADPSVRASAWEVVVRRGGNTGLERLRSRLTEFADQDRFGEMESRELAALAVLVGELKLPLESTIERLLARFATSAESQLLDAMWGCLTQCKAAKSRLPNLQQWFREKCLPELCKAMLRTSRHDENSLTNWLHAFRGCHVTVLKDLARLTDEVWPRLAHQTRISLLQVFAEMPQFAPLRAVENAFRSADEHLREAAIEILTEVSPERLVTLRNKDSRADQALHRKSVRDGTLFFETRYYSLSKLSFETYSVSPEGRMDRSTKSAKSG